MNLSQALQQSGVIDSMARELNIDEQTARVGAGALLPAIVAGMGRQTTPAASSGGLGGLAGALGGLLGGQSGGSSAGGGLGGGLGGALGGILLDQVLGQDPTPVQPGNDILGEIFGSKDVSRGVAEEVAGSTGISSDILKRMLPILAMAVMGYMMNGQQQSASAQQPAGGGAAGGALGGALGSILTQVVSGMARR